MKAMALGPHSSLTAVTIDGRFLAIRNLSPVGVIRITSPVRPYRWGFRSASTTIKSGPPLPASATNRLPSLRNARPRGFTRLDANCSRGNDDFGPAWWAALGSSAASAGSADSAAYTDRPVRPSDTLDTTPTPDPSPTPDRSRR